MLRENITGMDVQAGIRGRVTEFAQTLRPDDTGAYVGFLGNEGEARVREAYPGATWDQLRAIKARYDPTNVFHLNQNIPPASQRGRR